MEALFERRRIGRGGVANVHSDELIGVDYLLMVVGWLKQNFRRY